ncbi:DUF4192 domain-containing protein [Nocardioides guangzhouensis]|nr:DUF4192 domain-containing protein [Nocardioides guangzhouensis]
MTHTDPSLPSPTPVPSPGGGLPARTLLARSPGDLLAAVPVVLGFRATDSVVMLTFPRTPPRRRRRAGPSRQPEAFHARIDLPASPADLPEVADALLDPVLRHRIDRVALVVYTPDAALAAQAAGVLATRFTEAGVDLVDLLHADGKRWFALLPGRPPEAYAGTPYDDRSHPFLAQAVLDGRVTLGSRDALAAGLIADDQAAVEAVDQLARSLDRAGPEGHESERQWVDSALDRRLAGEAWSDGDVARLLVDLRDVRLRDLAWLRMTRSSAAGHVEVWRDVVRRCPAHLLPAPACLLAFAAWLAGHGALAWCALDRCRGADPDYRLAGLVATLLDHAVPPSTWHPPRDPDPDLAADATALRVRSQTARGTRH